MPDASAQPAYPPAEPARAAPASGPLDVSVIITTRNRRDLLREAIRSALGQEGGPEVVVVDDASSDGTAEMVRAEFPAVIFERSPAIRGYIVQRNRAFALASRGVVVTIDDDAVFTTPRVCRQALAHFDDPRVGAAALRFCHVYDRGDPDPAEYFPPFPDPRRRYAAVEFVGCASAVRRDLFNRLGGYREYLHHWGEETDFCVRLMDAGFVIEVGRNDLIHHFPSPVGRVYHHSKIHRNQLLIQWWNTPAAYLPLTVPAFMARSLLRSRRWPGPRYWAVGVAQGLGSAWATRADRAPVRPRVMRLIIDTRRDPARMKPLDDVAAIVAR